MPEQNYFQNALSNFAFETASGAAIRHLSDLGHTAKEISELLDFPTPYEKIQKTIWEHMLDTGILLTEEPGSGKPQEKSDYIKVYDSYGRPSFRQITLPSEPIGAIHWKEIPFSIYSTPTYKNGISALKEKCRQNGSENSYASCDFGILLSQNPAAFQVSLQALDRKQQEYLLGLPWPKRRCYHQLDARMQEIVFQLYEDNQYTGICYFQKTEEKVIFSI